MFYEVYDTYMNKRMININFIVEIKKIMGKTIIVTTTEEIATAQTYEQVKKELMKGA